MEKTIKTALKKLEEGYTFISILKVCLCYLSVLAFLFLFFFPFPAVFYFPLTSWLSKISISFFCPSQYYVAIIPFFTFILVLYIFFHSPLPPSLAFYIICFLSLSPLPHVSPLYCNGTSRSFKSEWWRFRCIWNKHECYKHGAPGIRPWHLCETRNCTEKKGISSSGLKGIRRRPQDLRRRKLATWQDIPELLYEELEEYQECWRRAL